MAILNNLYPPVFQRNYMPAFLCNEGCTIYFSISSYNNTNEVSDIVQVSVVDQKTNYSVLKYKNYFCQKSSTTKEGVFSIKIPNDIIDGSFKINTYYKVQLRFLKRGCSLENQLKENDSIINTFDSNIQNNLNDFSQWSTVCLIKPISDFKIKLAGWQHEGGQEEETTFYLNDINLIGKIEFEQKEEKEKLQSFQIILYNDIGEELENSKIIYKNNNEPMNQFSYLLKYNFNSSGSVSLLSYNLKVIVTTVNLYTKEDTFNFKLNETYYKELEATISASVDEKSGSAIVNIYSNKDSGTLTENLIIRRTSSRTNFQIWQDVQILLPSVGQVINETWYDRTVEPGIWYKYSAYLKNVNGFKSTSIETSNMIMVNPEDIFLTTADYQLKLRFDPQINNFSHVVSESLTTTLGSKYPFIRRNGNVDYRTFSLSGTISAFIDLRENTMKANYRDVYPRLNNVSENAIYVKQQQYNEDNNITLYNDYIQERFFRERVLEFLYADDVKLFRSAPQGNILVKLMNISLTPNNQLGRLIYSFSCTANEIDECTYQNFNKYNIQKLGEFYYPQKVYLAKYGELLYPSLGNYTYEGNGKVNYLKKYLPTKEKKEDLLIQIANKLNPDPNAEEYYKLEFLNYLKIEFTSRPYPIYFNQYQNPRTNKQVNQAHVLADGQYGTSTIPNNYLLGHIVTLFGQSFSEGQKRIVVGQDGVYELTDTLNVNLLNKDESETIIDFNEDYTLKITGVSFQPFETGKISYGAIVTASTKKGIIPIQVSNIYRHGQFYGMFDSNESIYKKILTKYGNKHTFVDTNKAYQEIVLYTVQSTLKATIEARPGTIIEVIENQQNGNNLHVVNETGLLEFYDDNTNIKDIRFIGTVLRKIEDNQPTIITPAEDEWFDTGQVYMNTDIIKNPMHNGVYTIYMTEQDLPPKAQENIIIENIKNKINQIYFLDEEFSLVPLIGEAQIDYSILGIKGNIPKPQGNIFTEEEKENLRQIIISTENVWKQVNNFVEEWALNKIKNTPVSSQTLKYLPESTENNLLKVFIYNQIIQGPVGATSNYIFYNGKWCRFIKDDEQPAYGIVLDSTYGIINYYVRIVKKIFQGDIKEEINLSTSNSSEGG